LLSTWWWEKKAEVVLFKLIPFVLAELFSLFVFFMFAPFSFLCSNLTFLVVKKYLHRLAMYCS
jgi:hypothetical protein